MTVAHVILAGGHSSRLPNKLLLPTLDCDCVLSMVIAKSIIYSGGNNHLFLVLPSSPNGIDPVTSYIRAVHSDLNRIFQQEPLGVCNALEPLATFKFDEFIIFFGDNIYDTLEMPPELGHASVREVKAPNADELDGWDDLNYKWVSMDLQPTWKLAGFIHVSHKQLEIIAAAKDLIEGLNEAEVMPSYVGDNFEWYDIGTPEAYCHYLQTGKKPQGDS